MKIANWTDGSEWVSQTTELIEKGQSPSFKFKFGDTRLGRLGVAESKTVTITEVSGIGHALTTVQFEVKKFNSKEEGDAWFEAIKKDANLKSLFEAIKKDANLKSLSKEAHKHVTKTSRAPTVSCTVTSEVNSRMEPIPPEEAKQPETGTDGKSLPLLVKVSTLLVGNAAWQKAILADHREEEPKTDKAVKAVKAAKAVKAVKAAVEAAVEAVKEAVKEAVTAVNKGMERDTLLESTLRDAIQVTSSFDFPALKPEPE
eukprot:3567087-Rhodomonas_salina.1